MRPAKRVLARFLRAKSIGNVRDLAREFEDQIDSYQSAESDLDLMLESQEQIEQLLSEVEDEDHLDRQEQMQLEDCRTFIYRHKHVFITFPEYSFRAMLLLGVRNLWFALMQQYALSPSHLRKVEQYSKFYAKNRMARKKDIQQALEAFQKLMAVYREQLDTLKEILATTKLRGEGIDGVRVLDAGSFKVVNTGGFDQATMEKVARVVKEAEKRLRAKGLGKVCYGEILVSNQIAQRKVLAFYVVPSDEMFIRADLEGHESDALKTVLHELGHRLHFKFMKQWDRGLRLIYKAIKQGIQVNQNEIVEAALNDPNTRPKPGDTVVDKRGNREFVVEAISFRKSVCTVNLALKENPNFKASIPLLGYLNLKGIKPPAVTSSTGGFVTGYAGKNHEENFAEMISYLCMNELPMDQVDMLMPYLTQI